MPVCVQAIDTYDWELNALRTQFPDGHIRHGGEVLHTQTPVETHFGFPLGPRTSKHTGDTISCTAPSFVRMPDKI